jgi:hypothetical protein
MQRLLPHSCSRDLKFLVRQIFTITSITSALISGGCATPPQIKDTASLEGAQHAFFPERYEYTVGDFVLSLPIGYYEYTITRLKFAEHILAEGTPKPVTDQARYLALPSDALAPARHFLLLDQRHLLVYSEAKSLDGGYPPSLEILERTSDAGWTDVTTATVPKWARSPNAVKFGRDPSYVEVVGDDQASRKLRWNDSRLLEMK